MRLSFSRWDRFFYIIGSGIFLAFVILRVSIITTFNPDVAGIEQNVIYGIQTLMHNQHLYTNPRTIPFSIIQYTPFYYFLCAFTAKVLGMDPVANIHSLYIIGRSYSLIFNLISAFICFKISRKIFKISHFNSLLIFLSSFSFLFFYNFAARPDSMQDALAMISIYLFFVYQSGSKSVESICKFLLPAILFSAAAVFTKQSGIQLLVIFLGFSFLIKDWRSLCVIVLFSALVYCGLLFVFMHQYPFFLDNIIGGVANGISIKNFFGYVWIRKVFILSGLPMIFVSCYFILKTKGIFKGTLEERLLCCFVLGTFSFATLTALKAGASTQYYVLFLNIAVIYIFYVLCNEKSTVQILGDKSTFNLLKYVQAYFLFCIAAYFIYDWKSKNTYISSPSITSARLKAEGVESFLKEHLKENNEKYFFSNLSFDATLRPSRQGINNRFFDQAVFPQLDVLESSSLPLKIVDYAEFERNLQNGRILYIIESVPRLDFIVSRNYNTIKDANYRLINNTDRYLIYEFHQ